MAGELPSTAFIGRAVELRRVDALLERAAQGRPQVVLVSGDAGVGKTRLLLALADRARRRGMRVLTGSCVELGDIGLPYLPVVDALRGLADDPEEAGLLAAAATTANPAGLTGRQVEVLGLLAEGLTDAEIAARLSLSAKTVGHHVSALLAKLGVGSRRQAVTVARRLGVVPAKDREPGGQR
jgi:DNA-binding CsgD family transcriptional regulator